MLAATGMYESALMFSGRMDPRLKALAELKAAALVTCQYCIDIGSALAARAGITPAQLLRRCRLRRARALSEHPPRVRASSPYRLTVATTLPRPPGHSGSADHPTPSPPRPDVRRPHCRYPGAPCAKGEDPSSGSPTRGTS
ncbi:carboxymuconolactone decarboxylase family protein [Nakamurella lactea]|uniref:carboxymuconolactone decarboxylase family protein n=1 Tax=Nakamurella lactea TaxID=459515 RepID=UPI000A03DBEF